MKKLFFFPTLLFYCLCFISCNQADKIKTDVLPIESDSLDEDIQSQEVQNPNWNITKHEQPLNLPPEGFIDNPDGTSVIGEGFIANGLRDTSSNKIIDPGTKIHPIEGKIKAYVDFAQNISERKDYLLIVMIDFIQQSFHSSDGIEYRTYPFTLEGYESIKIDIELPYPQEAKEFCYFIVSNPNVKDLSIEKENGWDEIYDAMTCSAGRFILNNFTYEESMFQFDKEDSETEETIGILCELTRDLNGYMVMPSCTSGEVVNLALGDELGANTCAIIAFLDWEQVPLEEETKQLYKLTKIMTDKISIHNIKIPKVLQPTPYQIFIFPAPFDADGYKYNRIDATKRTIISND